MNIERARELARMLRPVQLSEPNQVRLRELCDIIDPPQRMHPSLPREHRTSQAPGFAMIAPTDWIETTPRWHERCDAYQRASQYVAMIAESVDGVHQVMIVRDFCEWIGHQRMSHVIETIGDVLQLKRAEQRETVMEFAARIVQHVQARYA
ncbi:gp43 [Burkholderia phage BcepB1A]|uniref:gp43 n=1 Tax=Burkholderia phage BcepB1A TaxID=279530 RepID=UPI00003779A3|nr:gp43 [Burkholderia phage BcepB1A]AAT37744.1 gp43 [Burkholderia phage BcepB1A]